MVAKLTAALLAAVIVAHLEELPRDGETRRFRLVGVDAKAMPYTGLSFTALDYGSSVGLRPSGPDVEPISIEISRDGLRWETYPQSCPMVPLTNAGDRVWFRAGAEGNMSMFFTPNDFYRFEGTGRLEANGEVTSILDRKFVKDLAVDERMFCMFGLFWGCSALVKAPEMNATRIGDGTCMEMFRECTRLREAPVLPAVHVGGSGYGEMFYGCTALTNAPLIAATWADDIAFYSMFSGCSALRRVEVRLTSWKSSTGSGEDITTDGFGDDWMTGVPASGEFVKPSALPLERGTTRIPSGWTVRNR